MHPPRLLRERLRPICYPVNTVCVGDRPLGEHDSDEVGAFFENLQKYCDAVGNAIGVGPLDFRFAPGKGDVLDLIGVVQRGNRSGVTG